MNHAPVQPGVVTIDGKRYPEVVSVRFPHGTLRGPWSLNADGRVVIDGDMVLGSLEQVFPAPDPLASNRVPAVDLWPTNVIPYELDPALSAGQVDLVQVSMNTISRLTPIRFVDVTAAPGGSARIYFTDGNPSNDYCEAELGYPGSGNRARVWMHSCGTGTDPLRDVPALIHEIGHSLGLLHEHQRADRATFVDHDSACVRTGFGNQYSLDGITSGPYNLGSIMHYGSFSFSKNNAPGGTPDRIVNTAGLFYFDVAGMFEVGGIGAAYQDTYDEPLGRPPFRFRAHYDGPGGPATFRLFDQTGPTYDLIPEPTTTDGSWPGSEYSLILSGSYVNTTLPTATTTDLEDPGNWEIRADPLQPRPDCPVMLLEPHDISHPEAIFGAGLYLRNAGDLSGIWDLYGARVDLDGLPSASDRFGSDVVGGDFDGDGIIDLAVTAPGSDALVLYKGVFDPDLDTGEWQFLPWERVTMVGASTLAAGDFNGDGFDDLAVGSPLVASGTSVSEAGAVTILLGSGRGLETGYDPPAVTEEEDLHAGSATHDLSGEVVRVWSLHADQANGVLPLGVTRTFSLDGALFVGGAGTSFQRADLDDFLTCTDDTGAPGDKRGAVADLYATVGANVGASLLATDLDGDGLDDLLVGVPGAHSWLPAVDTSVTTSKSTIPGFLDTGAVLVLLGAPTFGPDDPALYVKDLLTPYTEVDPTPGLTLFTGSHDGARFGTSLAAADVDDDGCEEVFVGAPEDWSSLVAIPPETDGPHQGGSGPYTRRSGRVFVFDNRPDGAGGCLEPDPGEGDLVVCPAAFFAIAAFEDDQQQTGAEYGAAVAAQSTGAIVAIGAPGWDEGTAPVEPDAGRVDIWRGPMSGWPVGLAAPDQVIVEPYLAFGPVTDPAQDDRFGTSVALHGGELLGGSPRYESRKGAAFRFVDSGGSFNTVGGGFLLGGLLGSGAPTEARVGSSVRWLRWEGAGTSDPGAFLAAPGDGSTQSGQVIGVRANSTNAGAAWSLTDIEAVSP